MRTTYPPDGREQLGKPGREGCGMVSLTQPWVGGDENDFALVEQTLAYLACLGIGQDPGAALRASWEKFYGTYAPFVLQIARSRRRRLGNPDDGIQEVWQAIVTKLACFVMDPARGHLRGWILIVARRRLADCERREARWARHGSGIEVLAGVVGREEDPAVALERQSQQDLARSLIDGFRGSVSPLSYRVLQMRSIENKTVAEVATTLGLTADQVRARHHRMVRKLRELHGRA